MLGREIDAAIHAVAMPSRCGGSTADRPLRRQRWPRRSAAGQGRPGASQQSAGAGE